MEEIVILKTSLSFTWLAWREWGGAAHKTKGEEGHRNDNSSSDLVEISQSCAAGTAGTDSLGMTEQQDEACVTFITETKKNREN